ncbi:hypothetical protein ACFW2V_36125 [Streptomyces sp. NPDC058947]|uniref:hypothetical protein n=1 Tax=Streptomyces sp. NPDC058947 TaxID=3346675 RepID=UPI0036B84AB5
MHERQLRPTQIPLNDLATTYVQAGETLFLAIHDDIAARVRLAHPDAEHLEVSFDADGDVRLHGIWSAQDSAIGSCRLLYDPHNDPEQSWRDGPLDVDELVSDLDRVLNGAFLYRWGLVEPHPVHEHRDRRWLTLPPPDRAATVAAIVRRHVPDAESLICRFEATHRGVAVGFEQITLSSDERVNIPCPRCSPEFDDNPWPHDVSHELARLLAQLYALPHLRSRDLTPCMDVASEHKGQLWQLAFPYRELAPTDTAHH